VSEHGYDLLSYGDALFLYLERLGQPINVAALGVFEGEIPLEACIKFVESKLPLIPRYRQRVVAPPFNIGLPSWEYDPEFDIHNHVRQVNLKHGTVAELKVLAARILSETLDRNRPLWDITLLRGLKSNRTGAIVRMHHCLTDGISGVGLLNVLLDPSPVVRAAPTKKPRFHAPPPRDSMTLLRNGVLHSCFSAFERVFTAQAELLSIAQHLIAAAGRQQPELAEKNGLNSNEPIPTSDQLRRLIPGFVAPTERLPFNVVCRGPQKFDWIEIPMAEMNAIKLACGATVNDVVLALVTSAIRRYAELHGVRVRGRLLRILVPMSLRGQGDVSDMGNRITLLPVTIPLDISSPQELIAAIRNRMAFLKSAHVGEFVGLAGTLLSTIPTAVQALAGPIVSEFPVSVCNTICTNVPGPKVPLFLLGHKMQSCYPYVATGGYMGMNCAILTYNGVVHFGFTGDVHAMPDLERLGEFLSMSFGEMRKAVGIRSARPKRAPKTKDALNSAVVPPTPEPTAVSGKSASRVLSARQRVA
jgi:diacylglycerol O-acyltransferase